MSLPSANPSSGAQASIRSFFRPKQPTYAPPPSSSSPASRPPQVSSPPAAAAPNSAATPSVTIDLPSAPPLHPQASICPIQPEHIPALRRITALLLPVNYTDSFWASLSDPNSSGAFSRVLLWNEPNEPDSPPKVVGGLVCRPEPSPFHDKEGPGDRPNVLYIQSLVLLSPYRSLGLAASLLRDVASVAAVSPRFACSEMYAHVWTDNVDGLNWYLRRGFTQGPELPGYYFKLRPDSAWIVRRGMIGAIAATNNAASQQQQQFLVDGGSVVPSSTTAAAANLPGFSAAAAAAAKSTPPPPKATGGAAPPPLKSTTGAGRSYQTSGPATEWNDLPADMMVQNNTPPVPPISSSASASASQSNLLSPPLSLTTANGGGESGVSSAASSRSSSAVGGRKKRDRAYPAAAFGNS